MSRVATEEPTVTGTRRRVGWIVGGLALVWAVFVLGCWLAVKLPGGFDVLGSLASWAITSYSLYLVVPALGGLALLVWAWRIGWRWRTAGIALATAAALVLAFLPWADGARSAAAHGVPLSLSTYFSEGPARQRPDATEVYARPGGEELRVDVWRARHPATGNPAIVWVHGGAWLEGSRTDSARRNQWFADRGFTVFSVDYRLSPPPRWHQQTGDVKCALGWVRQHADQYGINPVNLSVGGDSAGANLAMLAAYSAGTGDLPPSCPVPETPVRSVVSLYGPTDIPRALRDSGTPSLLNRVVREHYGGTPESMPAAYRMTSPVSYVRPGLPPTLLVQGREDHVVTNSQARLLSDELDAAAVPQQVLELPWADHAFDIRHGAWSSQITRGVVARFLDERGH